MPTVALDELAGLARRALERAGASAPMAHATAAALVAAEAQGAGLDGMMLPAGGAKGAMLALVVELLCCALTGAHFGFEADSFFTDAGNRPKIGQAFLVVDTGALAGDDAYGTRVETLVAEMLSDEGVRLPGARREALAGKAATEGVEVPPALLAELRALAGAA